MSSFNINKLSRRCQVGGFDLDLNKKEDREDFLYCLAQADVSYVFLSNEGVVDTAENMLFDYDEHGNLSGFYDEGDPFAFDDWMCGLTDTAPDENHYDLIF